jgi:DNA repair exonuclease SbcCD ATPase subunit
VRAEVLELVFAAAVVVVFASAAAAVADRVSRRTLTLLTGVVAAAALGAWVVFALGPSRELAVAAGGLTVCAALEGATIVLQRLLARARRLDDQLQEAETRFDKVVSAEADARAAELERTLARARADSLSKLVAEERKIGEERRLALEERERRASAELSEALARVEQRVAHRLAELSTDLERTEQALSTQLKTLGDRQKQLMSQAESRLVLETERLDAASEAQRERLSTLDTQFTTTADGIAQSGQAELESHERDRRRALHEVAERLRQRERELRERIAAEEAEAIQRIQAGFADIERRQLDQLKRVVERTAESFSDAVSKQFADTIRNARDDAAQRLSRELDRAVQHFAKEAQNVLAERLAHVADAGGQRLERKLSQIGTTLEHERDELMADLQRRIADAEVELRSQVQTLAADAEAERTVLNARLQDLQRRIDEALTEAGSRLAPTFRER